jgi:PKD repeat protein
VAGVAFTSPAAKFTDADPAGTASDYAATINWGDGNFSLGTVNASGAGFAVAGTHTYISKGTYSVSVSVSDTGGAATAVNETINVGTLPVLVESAPVVSSSTAAAFAGSVNPNGLPTTAHFEYGLDPALRTAPGATYDQQTPTQTVGSDNTSHPFTANVTKLIPNATYHVRLVASNTAGSSFGPDQTFKTAQDPAPPLPTLAQSFDAKPINGTVFIKPPPGQTLGFAADAATLTKGKGFLPLTEPRLIPAGSQIDARTGTLQLIAATGTHHSKRKDGTFGGALFKATQAKSGITKGQTTLTLLEDLFPGAPGYNSCKVTKNTAGPLTAQTNTSRPSILQTLHAKDHNGKFRTRGRYSAGTVRGTIWDTTDECAGTLTTVTRGTVDVFDYGKRKTIHVHAGHHYLARAKKKK